MKDSSAKWRAAVFDYAKRINRYVEEGDRSGWSAPSTEPTPPALGPLLQVWLQELRRANASSEPNAIADFRAAWPACHEPLIPLLEGNSQAIAPLLQVSASEWLIRVGDPWAEGRCYLIGPDSAHERVDIEHFGGGPQGRYLALLEGGRINIYDGWQGPLVSSFERPLGTEGAPDGVQLATAYEGVPDTVYQLVPYDQGRRLLLVLHTGVLVLSAGAVTRLVPEPEELISSWSEADEREHSRGMVPFADMVHACVSPNEDLILAGIQDGRHRVFKADTCERIGVVGPHGEYPHHAGFSRDGRLAYFNACHFYNGATIGVPAEQLEGFDSDYYEEHPSITMLHEGARGYASVARGDEIILGDAYGYLYAVSAAGQLRWKHFVGSTISALALSRDETLLMVATFAGCIVQLALDSSEPAPERIGTSAHKEIRRWIFWKNEAQQPLIW